MSLTKTDLPVGSANKTYGKAVLTLDNCLLPEEILNNTPSRVDGLDEDSETSLRIWGCELIQTAGILLQLPQVAMATGQVLYQRFYYSKSLVRYDAEITSMACICLASKIEEAPRRIRDVINVFNHIKQINEQRKIQPVILDQNYIELKTKVIKAERRVLKELGFCVHIKHPHKIIVMYLQVLLIENNRKMMQMAWNYMNDSLRTNVFVRYSPEVIACACIYLSARVLKLPLPKNPNWYELFGVTESHIKDVCLTILRLYARPKPDMEEFNKKISEIRKAYQESRVKHRFETEPKIEETEKVNTGGAYNAFGAFISRSITEDQQPKHEKENKPGSKNRRSRSPVDRKRETKRNRSRSRHRSKERDRPKKRSKDRKRSSRSPSRSRSNKKSEKQESSPRIDRNRSPKKHKSSNKKYHSEKSRYRSRSRSLSRNEKHRHRSPENNKKSASNDKYYSEVRSSKYKKDYYLYDTNDK